MSIHEAPIKRLFEKIKPKPETLEWCSTYVDEDDIVWCFADWNSEDNMWEPIGDPFVLTEKEMMIWKLKNSDRTLNMTQIWGLSPALVIESTIDRLSSQVFQSHPKGEPSALQTQVWQSGAFKSLLEKDIHSLFRYKESALSSAG
jgi:hypothetical protein